MPALVNYSSGDGEMYSRGSFRADMAQFCSVGSYGDIYSPACKRARISSSFSFASDEISRNPSVDLLPDECVFEILRRVPGGKDRGSCASVSKRWLMVLSSIKRAEICKVAVQGSDDLEMVSGDKTVEVEDDGCLTRSLEGRKATDIRLAAIAVGTSSRGGLGKLSIRGNNSGLGVTDLGLSAIACGCPSLRTLSLWNVPLVGDHGLSQIAKECLSLEKLDLSHCPSISDKGLAAIAQNCKNLTALSIESCSNIGNAGLEAIGKLCPKLQSVSIKDCPLVGDHGLSALFSSAPALSKVKLQSLNITDFSLAVIGHYGKAVTSLVLCGLQYVSEKGFWVMGSAKGLQKLISLVITSCRGTTDLGLEAIAKGCLNLKQICIRKCSFVSDNGLINFTKAAAAAGSLESLQLEECNRVTELGIIGAIANCGGTLKTLSLVRCMGIKDTASGIPLPSQCSSLRSLSIKSCPGFGNLGLALVGKLCPQLEHLDLCGLSGITDAGLLPLLESCKAGLVKVNLSDCLNLTDDVVTALARLHGGTTLEVLNLDGCRKISDVSLAAIAEYCLFLSDLDVSKCSISDSGIAYLSSAEQLNLQVLSMSSCSEVSNKALPCLKRIGRTLVGLNLQHCNSISSTTIELLVESLWRCDILS
ncbi:EIN3-binding F-box protein 1 [Linum grandiflorum]